MLPGRQRQTSENYRCLYEADIWGPTSAKKLWGMLGTFKEYEGKERPVGPSVEHYWARQLPALLPPSSDTAISWLVIPGWCLPPRALAFCTVLGTSQRFSASYAFHETVRSKIFTLKEKLKKSGPLTRKGHLIRYAATMK